MLTIIVGTFFVLALFLFVFIVGKDASMIEVVLGVAFKIAAPCAILFLFFIKFGDYKN
jgi:hypothetical protein